MRKSGNEIDVVLDILETLLKNKPDGGFVKSLHKQYLERGGLSKKQMEGLLQIAQKSAALSPGKSATLEAMIKRRPNWDKKQPLTRTIADEKDVSILADIQALLDKFPAHKRVLFFKQKYTNNEPISAQELEELKRFKKLLLKD